MLSIEDIEKGSNVVHKNTGLRYAVVDVSDTEVLLSPESDATMQDLMVPLDLFLAEFIEGDRYSAPRSRGGGRGRGARRPAAPRAVPSGPKVRGRVKKLVPDRGFGFSEPQTLGTREFEFDLLRPDVGGWVERRSDHQLESEDLSGELLSWLIAEDGKRSLREN